MEKREELAVITNVDCGVRDGSTPIVWFTADLLIGCVLIVLPWTQAFDFIAKSGAYSLKELVGKAVVLSTNDNGTSYQFVRLK